MTPRQEANHARKAAFENLRGPIFHGSCLYSSDILAQMSPGELSRAHQDLDGPLACAKCHSFGKRSVQFKCLDCHQEIARRLAENRGYHARHVKPGLGGNDCARCHAEHNGGNHKLVRWPVPRDNFDHMQAGWRLEGKHRELKCAGCHNVKNLDPQDRRAQAARPEFGLRRTEYLLRVVPQRCSSRPVRPHLRKLPHTRLQMQTTQ